MEFERSVWKNKDSNSVLMVVPKDIADYLELIDGSEIVLQPEEGKHGRFCSFWNKKHTDPNKRMPNGEQPQQK